MNNNNHNNPQIIKLKEDIRFHSLKNDVLMDLILNTTDICLDECLNKESTNVKNNRMKFNYNEDCANICIKGLISAFNYSNQLENKR